MSFTTNLWPLDNSEQIFSLSPHVCTALQYILSQLCFWLTMQFLSLAVLPTSEFSPDSLSEFFFPSFIHKKFWQILRWFLLLCLASRNIQRLLGSCQHEMVLMLFKVHWLLCSHNSQRSQWKLESSAWSSRQCQRNILTILLDIKNTFPYSAMWLSRLIG